MGPRRRKWFPIQAGADAVAWKEGLSALLHHAAERFLEGARRTPPKVYFCGSIRGGRDDRPRYEAIVGHMQEAGCAVLTEHIARVTVTGEEAKDGMTDLQIYEKDMAWLREAEVVVAEVTTPSLGVGYELGQAEAMGKPVLLLFMKGEGGKRLSAMLAGNRRFEVCEYLRLEDALAAVDRFLARARR